MADLSMTVKDLDNKYLSRSCHTFLFYLNVKDKFLVEDDERGLLTLRQYLVSKSAFGEAPFIISFNLSRGCRFQSPEAEDLFIEILISIFRIKSEKEINEFKAIFKASKKDLAYFFSILFEAMRYGPDDLKKHDKDLYLRVYQDKKPKKGIGLFSIYINYLENIVPAGSSSSNYPQRDRHALESILELAQSMKIRKSGNLIILAAESLTSIASQLSSETNSISCFKVEFPDRSKRQVVYEYVKNKFRIKDGMPADQFSRISSGMSSNVIDSFCSELFYSNIPITEEAIFQKKKKFIDEMAQGLLEVQRPLWGIEAIGGLEEHKNYLQKVVKNMRIGNVAAVPGGILLLGAQGTGKTVFAEAIAHEADLPFVTLKNIREKWVGSSERNLDFALELILVQAPVVVFTDEIDQEYQSRDTMINADGGVNSRMQGRVFKFMSDTSLRGKVLWLGATNRPQNLDPALIRDGRFDDKIPFFPPAVEERIDIVRALIKKNLLAVKSAGADFKVGDLQDEEIKSFAKICVCKTSEGRLIKCDENDYQVLLKSEERDSEQYLYFTGGQIENLIRRAYMIASSDGEPLEFRHLKFALDDYIPPGDMLKYREYTEAAILFSNSMRFLPKSGRWRKVAERVLQMEDLNLDNIDFKK